MIFPIVLFLSGIFISVVAEYYSIAGLMAIFPSAPISVAIMGGALGIGKLSLASWLKAQWSQIPALMKTYGILSVCILMAITSIGCFGFLSKAHIDQAVPTGDVAAQIAIIDDKIATHKENINAAKQQLTQLDAAVDQTLSRSTNVQGANKAEYMRKSQVKERVELKAEIQRNQQEISKLTEEKRPFETNLRKVEAEVGPIKYIAAFIYGESNPEVLEKAVTWMILLIIVVFDPVAILLLLASQISFANIRSQEETILSKTQDMTPTPTESPIEEKETCPACGQGTLTEVIEKEFMEINGKRCYVNLHYNVCDYCKSELAGQAQSEQNIKEYQRAASTMTGPVDIPQPLQSTDNMAVPSDPVVDMRIPEPNLADDVDAIPEPHKWAESVPADIDWNKIPPDQEYITVGDQHMSVRAAKSLYPSKK